MFLLVYLPLFVIVNKFLRFKLRLSGVNTAIKMSDLHVPTPWGKQLTFSSISDGLPLFQREGLF